MTVTGNAAPVPHHPLLALTACVKNEEKMIRTCLDYHRALGVSKAYVYLDDCTDDTLEIVRSIPWAVPIILDQALAEMFRDMAQKQGCTMDDSLQRARRDGFDWLLSIDVDEFAFADNKILNSHEKMTVVDRANLVLMLASVPQDVDVVHLQTREALLCSVDENEPFFKNHFFQHPDRPLLHRLYDPFARKAVDWQGFLGHKEGKTIVRVSSDVQAFDQHRWVKNQHQQFPFSPAMLPVHVLEQGHHFHYSVASKAHFIAKYKKLDWEPDTWPCGTQVEYPKRLFRNVCTSLTESEVFDYLHHYVYRSKSECERVTQTSALFVDDSVEAILALTASSVLGTQERSSAVQTLHKHDIYKPQLHDPPLLPLSEKYSAGQLVETFCKGVLGLSRYEDKNYRWTKANAEIPLRALVGNYWLIINLGALHQLVDKGSIAIELNGHKIEPQNIRFNGAEVQALISANLLNESEWQTLRTYATLSEGHDWGSPKPDRGLPLFDISFKELGAVNFSREENYGNIESFSREMLDGFHDLEQHAERKFRWASTSSSLSFVAQAGDYDLKLDLGTLSSMVDLPSIQVFFNGHPLQASYAGCDGNVPTFNVTSECFSAGIMQKIQIKTRALDTSSWGGRETRQLGLPVFGIALTVLAPLKHS